MRSAFALRIISGRTILNFGVQKRLRAFLNPHFHGWGHNGKRHLQRRFLRKHGAAGERLLPLGGAVERSETEGL